MFWLLWQTVQNAGGRYCDNIKEKKDAQIGTENSTILYEKCMYQTIFIKSSNSGLFIIMIHLLATMNLFALSCIHVVRQ